MSAKTKIIVLRMKEIIYTALIIGLALFLIVLFLFMFRSGKDETSPSTEALPTVYTPGMYSASIQLGNQNANVEVTVDTNKITSVSLVPLTESIETMYPLMQPTLTELENKVLEAQTVENISYSTETKYTSLMLLNSISQALGKATIVTENTQPSVDEMQ